MEWTRRQERFQSTPFFIFSNSSLPLDRERALALGALDDQTKPGDGRALAVTHRQCLASVERVSGASNPLACLGG